MLLADREFSLRLATACVTSFPPSCFCFASGSSIPLVTNANVIPPLPFSSRVSFRIHVSLDVFLVEIKASHSYALINRMWIYEIESITCDVAADGVSTEFVSKWRERNEEGLGDRRGDGSSIYYTSMRVRETILRRSDVQRGATIEDNNRPAPQLC